MKKILVVSALVICLFGGYIMSKEGCRINVPAPQAKEEVSVAVSEKPNLVLYYRENCPYCVKVFDALENMGKNISEKKNLEKKESLDELISLGGSKQVPCLVIDGKPLFESSDIISWCQKHSELLD